MKDCDEALEKVFEDRVREFSPELRLLLRQLWCEGVRRGLYLEREDLPVPTEIIEMTRPKVRPLSSEKDDLRPVEEKVREPGHLEELQQVKDALIERTEELACVMESQIDYGPTVALKGRELVKARHRYLGQVGQLRAQVEAMLERVRRFSIHSF